MSVNFSIYWYLGRNERRSRAAATKRSKYVLDVATGQRQRAVARECDCLQKLVVSWKLSFEIPMFSPSTNSSRISGIDHISWCCVVVLDLHLSWWIFLIRGVSTNI